MIHTLLLAVLWRLLIGLLVRLLGIALMLLISWLLIRHVARVVAGLKVERRELGRAWAFQLKWWHAAGRLIYHL